MPYVKSKSDVQESSDPLFSQEFDPGHRDPTAGIYRCTLCGHEIAIAGDKVLPPDGDHGCKDPVPETILGAVFSGKQAAPKFKWKLVAAPVHRHGVR